MVFNHMYVSLRSSAGLPLSRKRSAYSKQLMLNQIQPAPSIAASCKMIYDPCVLRTERTAAFAVAVLANLTKVTSVCALKQK